MSADRFFLTQSGHVAMLLAPVDATGGKHSAAFNFKNYAHASLLIGFGVTAAAVTDFIVEACTAQDGTGATAIAFNVAKSETTNGDVLGVQTAVATSGVVPPATDNIFYVVEIDSAAMPAGSSYLRVSIANGSNSALATIWAILSGSRYAGDQSPTVLA
jgi:hypothetical protein